MILVGMCLGLVLTELKYRYFYSDIKPLNDLTKTTGLVKSANYWLKGEGKLVVKSDSGTTMRYLIDKRDKKIYEPIIGKRATIYSHTQPLGEYILQLEDTNGKILIEYDYDEELKTPQRQKNFSYNCVKASVLLLFIVWCLNHDDFTKPKTTKPPKTKKPKFAKFKR